MCRQLICRTLLLAACCLGVLVACMSVAGSSKEQDATRRRDALRQMQAKHKTKAVETKDSEVEATKRREALLKQMEAIKSKQKAKK